MTERLAPQGFTEQEWLTAHKPFYYLTAPKGLVIGIYTSAREALDKLRPDLRIDCQLGLEGERRTIVPARRGV